MTTIDRIGAPHGKMTARDRHAHPETAFEEHRTSNGDGGCMLHNPRYDFNDERLPIGASYWATLVEHVLAR
jgi:metal-dependent amidase/aminoacylase/carboxypeptidase family protein